MNPALMGFCFGVVVGGFGGIFLIGLFFLFGERAREEKITVLHTSQVAPELVLVTSRTPIRKDVCKPGF